MSVHRPVIEPELAEEIDRQRGLVPFQRFVNDLLRQVLAPVALKRIAEEVTAEAGFEPDAREAQAPDEPLPPLPKIAPRRSV